MIDDTEEHGISNPFTTKLSPELQALKEQQAHSLAPRSGQSRILRKARQKMAEEAQKKVEESRDSPGCVPQSRQRRGTEMGAGGKDRRYMGQAGVSATHKAGCGVLGVVGSREFIWLSNPALTKLLCHHPGATKGR